MLLRFAALILALAASPFASGEGRDGPGRLAWLTYVEGTVEFQGVNERRTTSLPKRPLLPGDRLATQDDSRAEVSLGTAAIRLDEGTELAIADLGAKSVRVALAGKVASVHLFELLEGERFELVTSPARIVLDAAGEYRVDFMTESAITLSVRSGAATVATAGGPIQVLTGQRVHLEGRGARAILMSARARDDFDDWVLEREVQLAGAPPPPDSDAGEYAQYGQWTDEPGYGRVWASSSTRERWGWSGIWVGSGGGWAWVGNAPCCGSIHGGRWVWGDQSNRWCWVPPRPLPQPLPQLARETRPYGRASGSVRRVSVPSWYDRTTPVATGFGGGTRPAAQPRVYGGGSTMGASTSSSSSSSSSRPMGGSSSRRSSSSSAPLSSGSLYSPRR